MVGDPDPKFLQQIVVFYIIYYLCRRGRENLGKMSINMFAIDVDPETNLSFIYQKVDEADKNHNQNDMYKANQVRIYEVRCKKNSLLSNVMANSHWRFFQARSERFFSRSNGYCHFL